MRSADQSQKVCMEADWKPYFWARPQVQSPVDVLAECEGLQVLP